MYMGDVNRPQFGLPYPEDAAVIGDVMSQRLQRPVPRRLLANTAAIEALAPDTVFRTANGSIGKVFGDVNDDGIARIVQWVGTDLADLLPRDNAYPFPDLMFPAEVIWSPDDRA